MKAHSTSFFKPGLKRVLKVSEVQTVAQFSGAFDEIRLKTWSRSPSNHLCGHLRSG